MSAASTACQKLVKHVPGESERVAVYMHSALFQHLHTNTHTHTHTHTCIKRHTHTHTHTQTHANTHTHTHTHTNVPDSSCFHLRWHHPPVAVPRHHFRRSTIQSQGLNQKAHVRTHTKTHTPKHTHAHTPHGVPKPLCHRMFF